MDQSTNNQYSAPEQKKKKKPAQFKEKKDQAEKILAFQGESYYEWLHKQHEKVIFDGLPNLLESITK